MNYYQCNVPNSSLPPVDALNPEFYLNSAYWPAEKRPDIETYAILKYGYDYHNCSDKLPHYCFLLDAQAVGYPVTHIPKVGDLWLAPGECLGWGGSGATLLPGCTDTANDWYMGYVEKVFADGSFIQSGGGSDSLPDSGLSETWFSGAMDPYTSFIGLMPPGIRKPGGSGSSPSQPTACIVPGLIHLTLSQSRHALHSAHCELGHFQASSRSPHRVLRVSHQSARSESQHPAGYRVNIRLS
jgi:hypothetical protein